MKVLLIDNYDSFTYNLAHQIGGVSGRFPEVIRNDKFEVEDVMAEGYSHIVLSPGPGRPDVARDVGRCAELLQVWNRPLLGVCLGHQCLVHQFQGKIERLDDVVHGRTDEIHHSGEGIFAGDSHRIPGDGISFAGCGRAIAKISHQDRVD